MDIDQKKKSFRKLKKCKLCLNGKKKLKSYISSSNKHKLISKIKKISNKFKLNVLTFKKIGLIKIKKK